MSDDGVELHPRAIRELARLIGTLSWADDVKIRIRTSLLEGKPVPVAEVTWYHQRDAPNGLTEKYLLLEGAARLE